MQVHNVECQLARAQMNLYLAGDPMAPETVEELERHVGQCAECRAALQEKKQSLQAMLKVVGGPDVPAPAEPLLRVERPQPKVQVAPEEVPAALRPAGETKSGVVRNWKPIAYSGALALVLAAMSFLGDPTGFFGSSAAQDKPEKAIATKPEAEPKEKAKAAEAAVAATSEGETDPLAEIDSPPMRSGADRPAAKLAVSKSKGDERTTAVTPPAPPPAKSQVAGSAAPKKAPSKHKPSVVAKRKPVKRAPAQKSSSTPSGLRVYDENGKPVPIRR